jgi:hypothetical protein
MDVHCSTTFAKAKLIAVKGQQTERRWSKLAEWLSALRAAPGDNTAHSVCRAF